MHTSKVEELVVKLGSLLSRLEGQIDPAYAGDLVRKLVDAAREEGRNDPHTKKVRPDDEKMQAYFAEKAAKEFLESRILALRNLSSVITNTRKLPIIEKAIAALKEIEQS